MKARRGAVPAMTGTVLQANVIDLAHLLGLHVAHFRPARLAPDPVTGAERWRTAVAADGKGYPDLTIVGARGVIWRENKGAHEVVKPEQQRWLDWLLEAGCDAAIWRPVDWPERIHRELRAIARPRG